MTTRTSDESWRRSVLKAVAAFIACGVAAILFVGPPEPRAAGYDPSAIVPASRIAQMDRHYQRVDFSRLSGFPYGEDPMESYSRPARVVSYDIPAEIAALSGEAVAVTGFMLPLDVQPGGGVTTFLLNATMDMCYFGAPTLPNQFIVVTMAGGRRAPFVHTPIIVLGTLAVREERRDGKVTSLYALEADAVSLRP